MKNTLRFFFFLVFFSIQNLYAQLQNTQPDFKTGSFQAGESLKYKIRYGFITAAEASLEVQEGKKQSNGEKSFHYIAHGKTTGSFDFFMHVKNRYDSYVDQQTLLPYQFTENVREGNYKRNSYANFDRADNKVQASKGTYNVPANTFDIISLYYFARSLDLKNISVGESVHMNYFLDKAVYPANIEYLGKETISTETGKYECLKVSPTLQPGRVFRRDSKMYIWISNDANRIPVKIEVEILIGSLILELQSYSGLKYPVTAKRN